MDLVGDRLVIASHNLGERINKVFEKQLAEGAQILSSLVEETSDLVEGHSPEAGYEPAG